MGKIFLAAWLALLPAMAQAEGHVCEGVIQGRHYAFGADAIDDGDAYFQFGFESEFTLDEVDGLLKYYSPKFANPQDQAAWTQKSADEKHQWIRQQYGTRPEFAQKTEMILTNHDPEMSFLPDHLLLDPTGNLEVVLEPVDTIAKWRQQVTLIQQRIGAGSMQAMLSVPKKYFFGKTAGLSVEAAVDQDLGWLAFIADLDLLSKMESGAQRFKKDSSKEVARSLAHPFLGPMNKVKWTHLREFLSANATGKGFDSETLKFMRTDASFKFIGATTYRPDIAGPDRIGLEVRSAHKDLNLLDSQVRQVMQALAADRARYATLAQVSPFDGQADFEKLPAPVQTLLKKLFPVKTNPNFKYSAEEILCDEVFRNFSFPMRAWTGYLEAMQASPEIGKQVQQAQTQYLNRLLDIQARAGNGQLTDDQARVQIEGAIALFVDESGLLPLFQSFQNRHVSQNAS